MLLITFDNFLIALNFQLLIILKPLDQTGLSLQ